MLLISSDHHHHGYVEFARQLPGGLTTRMAELLGCEAAMAEIAGRFGCKHHLRDGDLFDRKNMVDAVVYAEVAARLDTNQRAGIEEHAIPGNHDAAGGGLRNSLETLAHGRLLDVIDTPRMWTIGNLLIHSVPYMEKAEAQRAAIKDQLAARKHDGPRMLMTHAEVKGAKSGSEFLLPGKLTLEDLSVDAFDLVFLGHIHEPQQLKDHVHYVGSMCQRSFQDMGEQRSCIVLNEDTLAWERVPLPGPSFAVAVFTDQEDIDHFTPDPNTYYRVILRSRDVTMKAVDAAFDGRAKGWTGGHDLARETPTQRLSPGLTRWEDIITDYVQRATTPLDRARLVETALRLMGQAS